MPVKKSYTAVEAVQECNKSYKEGRADAFLAAARWHEAQEPYDQGQRIAHEISAAHFRALSAAAEQGGEKKDG